VENSWQNRAKRDCDEEVKVFRKPDRQHPKGSRNKNSTRRSVALEDLIRRHSFSKASFYKWKGKYSGMSVSELKRLKELEEENRRLKQMYANLSLEHEALKDVIEKKL